jgi:hypothetical protein
MDRDEWNAALLKDVRSRAVTGRRLYLFVDRDLLSRLSGLAPCDAVTAFSDAVRAQMGGEPFGWAARAAVRWKLDGFIGDPAFVAELAMTVLAVTEKPLGWANGIYARQNQLLGLPAKPAAPPGYGEHVPLLWNVWNAWLDGPGAACGRSSARTHPHWSLQGWARSQGLIRYGDRRSIEQFVAGLGPHITTSPGVDELLMSWTYQGNAGANLRARFAGEAERQLLQDVLDDEFERWRDEGPRAGSGVRRQALLLFDDLDGEFWGAVPVDPTLHGVVLDTGSGEQTPDEFDPYVRVRSQVSTARLLSDGVEHALTDTVSVRFGGEPVYVMRDDARVDGWLQCREISGSGHVRVLAPARDAAKLVEDLRRAGVDASSRAAGPAGWTWLESVRVPDGADDVLRLLGLRPAARQDEEQVVLRGGLPIGPSTYLTGGEPDVVAAGADVAIDSRPLALPPDWRSISLADLHLAPGVHRLTTSGRNRTINTTDFVRESAVDGSVVRPIERTSGGFRFGDAARGPATGDTLAGAALDGVVVAEPILVRHRPGSECFVIGAGGHVTEIWPTVPRWLREIDVVPSGIDVLDAVREAVRDPICLVLRHGTHKVKHAVAVPRDAVLTPGTPPSEPRQDVVPDLVADRNWRWTGARDERIGPALALALRRGHTGSSTGASSPRAKPASPSTPRPDVHDGRLAANPYDDVLTWLSEREHGRASNATFAETWAWLCHRYQYDRRAGDWRLALRTLAWLGHIERDFERQQVAVAPATLVALPSAAGMYALTGARPLRLVERMDEPDDADPAVADAAARWDLQFRTRTGPDGFPLGPTTVFVAADGSERETVREGLRRLGVSLRGLVAVALLEMQPSLSQALAIRQRLSVSPTAEPRRLTPRPDGSWEWTPSVDDRLPGLYCFRPKGRKVFAWRNAAGEDLVALDKATGEWLCRVRRGDVSLLVHDPVSRRLLTPIDLPLPDLLARALTLRSGLPPRGVSVRQAGDGAGRYMAYENVDGNAALRVAGLLEQNLESSDGSLRMEW